MNHITFINYAKNVISRGMRQESAIVNDRGSSLDLMVWHNRFFNEINE